MCSHNQQINLLNALMWVWEKNIFNNEGGVVKIMMVDDAQ